MTIDDEDNLWIALYFGGSIIKVNPKTGDLLQVIEKYFHIFFSSTSTCSLTTYWNLPIFQVIALPARDVTSAMWGGPNLDILFVTSSRFSLSTKERKQFPAAGSLFAIKNLKAKGLPAFGADIVDSI